MQTVEDEAEQFDTVLIYRSFHEALQPLGMRRYGIVMFAINDYALNGKIPTGLDTVCTSLFTVIKAFIDSRKDKIANGGKGGKSGGTDADTRQAILNALSNGERAKDVAEKFGVSKKTVYNIAKSVSESVSESNTQCNTQPVTHEKSESVTSNDNDNVKEKENGKENGNANANDCASVHNAQCNSQPVTQCTNAHVSAQPPDFVALHDAEYTAIVNAWNSAGLPRCTSTMLANVSGDDLKKVRGFFDAYGGNAQNEAVSAIRNFAKMRSDSRYDLGYRNTYGFWGFLEKGVGAFADSAKPFETFAKQRPKYGSGVTQSGCDEVRSEPDF